MPKTKTETERSTGSVEFFIRVLILNSSLGHWAAIVKKWDISKTSAAIH